MKSIKQFSKNAVCCFLGRLVKIKLARTHPIIIGITGSFGKTSTKEAVYSVLKTKWKVCKSLKSLNTETGLLLAALEQPSGFSSPLKWIKILAKACANAFRGAKYDYLILEYGADKQGDISRLISAVKPHISIITGIARVHQADGQFPNEKAVFDEKKKLVTCLGSDGIAILNYRDKALKTLDGTLAAKTFWFNGKDIYAENPVGKANGFSSTIHSTSQKIHADFSIAGSYHINVILPALLCGLLGGISLEEGAKALKNFSLPPGRMSVIPGENGMTLLDSSYNASPETMKQALDLLHSYPGKRKIAVLGNMNELGAYSEEGHKDVVHKIGLWLDMLVTVGDAASIIAHEALKKGFPKSRIKVLLTATEAGEMLEKNKWHAGDVVLFKGSQNAVRLERTVKMLMAHPSDAKKLLCRQEPEWEKIE